MNARDKENKENKSAKKNTENKGRNIIEKYTWKKKNNCKNDKIGWDKIKQVRKKMKKRLKETNEIERENKKEIDEWMKDS